MNGLHKPADDREGQHSIAINDQWRICFRFEGGDAFDLGLIARGVFKGMFK